MRSRTDKMRIFCAGGGFRAEGGEWWSVIKNFRQHAILAGCFGCEMGIRFLHFSFARKFVKGPIYWCGMCSFKGLGKTENPTFYS